MAYIRFNTKPSPITNISRYTNHLQTHILNSNPNRSPYTNLSTKVDNKPNPSPTLKTNTYNLKRKNISLIQINHCNVNLLNLFLTLKILKLMLIIIIPCEISPNPFLVTSRLKLKIIDRRQDY